MTGYRNEEAVDLRLVGLRSKTGKPEKQSYEANVTYFERNSVKNKTQINN
jgi:hypothetical protein